MNDYGIGHDGYDITWLGQTRHHENKKFIHEFKINGKDEKLTIYYPDKEGWARSGLEVPLHISRDVALPLYHMFYSFIGARDYKLVEHGTKQIMYFKFV